MSVTRRRPGRGKGSDGDSTAKGGEVRDHRKGPARRGEVSAKIDSHLYPVTRWTLSSLTIPDYEGDLIARQRFRFTLKVQAETDPQSFEIDSMGQVVSIGDNGLEARVQPVSDRAKGYFRDAYEYHRKWYRG